MNNQINSENLSSIIFFSQSDYATGALQASYLADRRYGESIEGLGTLSKTSSGDIYWSNYRNIIYKETEYNFNKLKDIYQEALTYASLYIDDFSDNVSILNGRYTANYTYQTDLGNKYSNAETKSFDDLKNFLCSLNYQTFNKQQMYHGENEVNSVRIGIRTFDWHYANEITFSELIQDEYTTTYSYSYNYTVINENEEEEELTYSYSYDYIVPAVYLDHHFGQDNYYAYIKKNYIPIDETLRNEISVDLAEFEDAHSNNEDIYTYYMNECQISIPMTLNTRSLGQKKSTFIIGFDSDYSGWFYDVVKFKAEIPDDGKYRMLAKVTSGVDNAVFSVRKNENEKFCILDPTIDNNETDFIWNNGSSTIEDTLSVTTPYKMKELSLDPISQYITGAVDVANSGWTSKGNLMKSLVLGTESSSSNINKVYGLSNLSELEYLNLKNVNQLINTPSISNLGKLKVFDAAGSNITTFKPKENSTLYEAWLPETIKSIKLKSINLIPGSLNIFGKHTDFFGRINYEPNAELQSFTCVGTRNIDTYEFMEKWITALKAEDKLHLSQLIYLELDNINWMNTSISMMYDLKQFDLDINESTERKGLSGIISIYGTGNYGLLTIEEYATLLRMYGRNALTSIGNEKVFSDLVLSLRANIIEPYEFYMNVNNKSIQQDHLANVPLSAELIFDEVETAKPISSISFIEILKEEGVNRTLEFEVNNYDKYVYCKLDKSIDTTNSVEMTPQKGDIMLFNGDTIIIFFGTPVNRYKYVKLGNIIDKEYEDPFTGKKSSFDVWFQDIDSITLEFAPVEKPEVISSIGISSLNDRNYIIPGSNDESDKSLELHVNLDKGDINNTVVSVNSDIPPIQINQEENNLIISNDPNNNFRDIVSTITVKSTQSDEYIQALNINVEDLVNDSFEVVVAKEATYDENTDIISLSKYLYKVENDILVGIDENVMSVEEDENSITITLK